MAAQRTYLAIDLKSFYASVECVDRHLDPLTTNLVVADASRTEKTICLAVSPSLKAYKIPGRARLFEAVQRVKEVNAQRLQTAIRQKKAVRGEDGKYHFAGTSFDANALNADPALGLSYIVAPPRMQRYLDVSTQIYKTYLKYVSPADIYPYSIDEVFIDVTGYLPYYHMSAHELAMTMVREVLYNTGITATAGIGTNLYLAKLAMDIVAKHIPADKDGVRIAELDEQSYRYLLWNHRPLTDFWMTGPGTVKRLEAHGIYTMGDLARFSIHREDRLYEIFGVDAEILIDHAWGYEPCGMAEIKSYKPSTNSISEGQVLTCPYPNDKAKLIIREMAELLMFRLTEKKLVTESITLDEIDDQGYVARRGCGLGSLLADGDGFHPVDACGRDRDAAEPLLFAVRTGCRSGYADGRVARAFGPVEREAPAGCHGLPGGGRRDGEGLRGAGFGAQQDVVRADRQRRRVFVVVAAAGGRGKGGRQQQQACEGPRESECLHKIIFFVSG